MDIWIALIPVLLGGKESASKSEEYDAGGKIKPVVIWDSRLAESLFGIVGEHDPIYNYNSNRNSSNNQLRQKGLVKVNFNQKDANGKEEKEVPLDERIAVRKDDKIECGYHNYPLCEEKVRLACNLCII